MHRHIHTYIHTGDRLFTAGPKGCHAWCRHSELRVQQQLESVPGVLPSEMMDCLLFCHPSSGCARPHRCPWPSRHYSRRSEPLPLQPFPSYIPIYTASRSCSPLFLSSSHSLPPLRALIVIILDHKSPHPHPRPRPRPSRQPPTANRQPSYSSQVPFTRTGGSLFRSVTTFSYVCHVRLAVRQPSHPARPPSPSHLALPPLPTRPWPYVVPNVGLHSSP
jgi:hypothetical protein